MHQHPVTERDCAAFQPISFAFLIILALKHEAVFLISSPSPSAASLCPQVISSWQCPAHVPLINLLQTAFPWALHHSHSSFRDDLPSQRLCGSHRNIRSSEFPSRCELAALGAAQPRIFHGREMQEQFWRGCRGGTSFADLPQSQQTAPGFPQELIFLTWSRNSQHRGFHHPLLPLQGHFHHEKQNLLLLHDIFIINVLSSS